MIKIIFKKIYILNHDYYSSKKYIFFVCGHFTFKINFKSQKLRGSS